MTQTSSVGEDREVGEPDVPADARRRVLTSPVTLVAGVGLLVAVAVVTRYEQAFPDDAYITFRYARNLADGAGWAYNVGETSANAATSPLWTGLLALAYWLRADMMANVNVLQALSMAGSGALLTATALRVTGRRLTAIVVGLTGTVVLATFPWLTSTHGMESWLFLLLTTATLWAMVDDRPVTAGVFAGLLTLTRGEGAILAVLVVVWAAIRYRAVPWRVVAGGAAVAIPWAVFALLALGAVVPDTMSAKVAQGESGWWGYGYIYLRGFDEIPALFNWRRPVLVMEVFGAAGVVGAFTDRRWWPYIGVLAGFTGLQILAYGLVLQVPNYHWYYALPYYALGVAGAIGTGRAVTWAVDGIRARDRRAIAVAAALPALVLAGMSTRYGWQRQPQGECCADYRAVAAWVEDNVADDESLAASEIGVLGWYTDVEMVDYLGLLDPQSTEDLRTADMVSWLERNEPDYWLVHDDPSEPGLQPWPMEAQGATAPWFDDVFTPVLREQGVVLFERVAPIPDLPDPDAA